MKSRFAKDVTVGQKYLPATQITSQEEADEYFEECVQHSISLGNSREQAVLIERSNIGYFSGYFDVEIQRRIERLFKCSTGLSAMLNISGNYDSNE